MKRVSSWLCAIVLASSSLVANAALAAPVLPAFTSLTGATITPAQMHGKVTVVALFSVTCPFCINEAPKLQKLYLQNRAVLNVIAVSVDRTDPIRGARAWIERHGLTHLVTTDAARFESVLGKPKGIPSVYVFDRAGKLVRSEIGEMLDEDFAEIATYAKGLR